MGDLGDVFGRAAELAVVESVLDALADGPSAILLSGEAGVGKTTLLREALALSRHRSMWVLTCQPVETEAKLSFAALADLFGSVLDQDDVPLPLPQAKALDVALLRAEPEGPTPDSRAVSTAVLTTMRFLAAARPLIVAIDDIQWLDGATARVLEFALRRLTVEPIVLVVAARTAGEAPLPFGLDRVIPEERVHRLVVGPLGVDAIGLLVQSRLGATFRRPLVVRLHELSGGNAFFALEIARASMRGQGPAAGEPLPVPSSLRELIGQQVSGLSAGDRTTLLVVAAMSRPTVAAVEAAVDRKRLQGILRRGQEAGLVVVEGDEIRFAHPLFGSAILADASAEERRAVHRRLAEVSSEPEERARHLALGTSGPDEDVATELVEAARLSRSRGAPDAAAELCEIAVGLTAPERTAERADRQVEAATHHVAAGDLVRAQALADQAVAGAPPGPQLARGLMFLARIRPLVNESWTTVIEVSRRAMDQAGGADELQGEIEQLLGYAMLFTGDIPSAVPHARAAVDLAERANDPLAVAEALQFVAYLEFARGHGVRTDLLNRAVALEHETEGRWITDEVRPSFTLARILKYTERSEEARAAFQAMLEAAMERGREQPLPSLSAHLAELETWAGRWEHARTLAVQSLEAAEERGEGAHNRMLALHALALVDAHRGDTDAAREAASEGVSLAEGLGLVMFQIQHLSVLGFLELFEENPKESLRHLDRAAALTERMGVEEPALFRFDPDLVEALVAAGNLGRAAEVLDRFEERAIRLDRDWARATAARCRGLVLAAEGDLAGALSAFDRALEAHERVPEPFALARTLFCLGRTQRRAKLRSEARSSFERVLEIYGGLGARRWAERAGREARRVGIRAAGPLDLTATEQRVAALVGEGRTNREAADALFLSVNTIEWNLSRIYRKLGVRSRTELAARMRTPEE
jgi:DNA-binding CsgD family transcriptional regulator